MKMHQNTREIYITGSACGGSSALHVFTCKQKFLPFPPPPPHFVLALRFASQLLISLLQPCFVCVCVCVCFFLPFFGCRFFLEKITKICRIFAFLFKYWTKNRESFFFKNMAMFFLHIVLIQ
jgi:hypothetical protein